MSVEETLLGHEAATERLGGVQVVRKRLHDDTQPADSPTEGSSPSKGKLQGKLAAGLEAIKVGKLSSIGRRDRVKRLLVRLLSL